MRSVSLDSQTPRNEVKNKMLTNFEVFGYLMKNDCQVYDVASPTNPYLKRKSGSKLSKFYAN